MKRVIFVAIVALAIGALTYSQHTGIHRLEGMWGSKDNMLTIETSEGIDSLRIVNIIDGWVFHAIGRRRDYLGSWRLLSSASSEQGDFVSVTFDRQTRVYELLEVNSYNLVLRESSGGRNGKGPSNQGSYRRVRY